MQFAAEKVIPVTLIPGDGIGPEIVEASVMVLDALHAPFAWDVHQAGMSGLEALGDPLPQTTVWTASDAPDWR
jgi:isocitrate dehydrogenase (NAD+)